MATVRYSTIQCAHCGALLTRGEAAVYQARPRTMYYYCARHRACPDDCRRRPCMLQMKNANHILKEVLARQERLSQMGTIQLTRRQIARLIKTGVQRGTLKYQDTVLSWVLHRGAIYYSMD